MDANRTCPGCQKPLPPDVPLGLCPECLIKAGFNTGTEPAGEGAAFVPPTVEQLAKLFPQLEIVEFIGKGGMGAVYKARQPALEPVPTRRAAGGLRDAPLWGSVRTADFLPVAAASRCRADRQVRS